MANQGGQSLLAQMLEEGGVSEEEFERLGGHPTEREPNDDKASGEDKSYPLLALPKELRMEIY